MSAKLVIAIISLITACFAAIVSFKLFLDARRLERWAKEMNERRERESK